MRLVRLGCLAALGKRAAVGVGNELECPLGAALPSKTPGALLGLAGQRHTPRTVLDQGPHRPGDRRRNRGIEILPSVTQHLRQAASIRTSHRQPDRHALQQGNPEGFAARGKNEDVGRLQASRKFPPGQERRLRDKLTFGVDLPHGFLRKALRLSRAPAHQCHADLQAGMAEDPDRPHHLPLVLIHFGVGDVDALNCGQISDVPIHAGFEAKEIRLNPVGHEGRPSERPAVPLDHRRTVLAEKNHAPGTSKRQVLQVQDQVESEPPFPREAPHYVGLVGEKVLTQDDLRGEPADAARISREQHRAAVLSQFARQGEPLPSDLPRQRTLEPVGSVRNQPGTRRQFGQQVIVAPNMNPADAIIGRIHVSEHAGQMGMASTRPAARGVHAKNDYRTGFVVLFLENGRFYSEWH